MILRLTRPVLRNMLCSDKMELLRDVHRGLGTTMPQNFAALRVLLQQAYLALLLQDPRREAFRFSLIRGEFPCPLFREIWNSGSAILRICASARFTIQPPFFILSSSRSNHTQFFNCPPSLTNDTFRSLFYVYPFISPPSPSSSSFHPQMPRIS